MFALCLALLGIYGVISYTVTHRTQEIGVRIALGASAGQVQPRIIRETMELAVAGIVLGTIAAWIAGRALSGFLFGVTAADPVTYAAMVARVVGRRDREWLSAGASRIANRSDRRAARSLAGDAHARSCISVCRTACGEGD